MASRIRSRPRLAGAWSRSGQRGITSFGSGRRPTRAGGLRWLVLAALGLAALSLLLPSAPSYDPWSWLNWGREVTALDLDTRGGPAWKPLPVLFTTPFAVLGDAAPYLWLVVARAGGLLAAAAVFALALRLAGGSAGSIGAIAGLVAALGLAATSGFVREVALGHSEGLLVALTLGACLRHLDGRPGQALALGLGAALLRPEAWLFFAAYGLYLWLSEPQLRHLVAGAGALVPALWFLPELWGSGDLLRSSSRAQLLEPDSPAFAPDPALEVLRRFEDLLIAPIEAGALVAVVAAAAALVRWGADRAVLLLAAGAAAWVAVVAAMAQAGYAGEPRYLAVAAGGACVLAGVGVARVVAAARTAASRGRGLRATGAPRRVAGVARIAVPLALLAAVAALASPRASLVPDVAEGLEGDARLWDDLQTAISRAGGSERLDACGEAATSAEYVPMVAWELRVHGIDVGLEPRAPGVVFQAPPAKDRPPAPVVPERRFRPVAAGGEWRILASCGDEIGGRPASARAAIVSSPTLP